MIRAVVLDVDDTIYDYWTGHRYAFDAVCGYVQLHLGIPRERFEQLNQASIDGHTAQVGANCAAIHNRLIRYQRILEQLALPLNHAPVMDKLYWNMLLDHMRPAPDLLETAQRIKAAGLRLGVGTNMTADWQFEKLERLGLLPLVDFVVSSEEVNAEKPDPRLFLACALKAGCAPSECLFVGDSLSHDMAGALAAGMVPVWLAPEPEQQAPEGVITVSRLSQVMDVVAERGGPDV